ncbi:MAG: DUF721 domain-containing protein [Thermoleophilia bacterium]
MRGAPEGGASDGGRPSGSAPDGSTPTDGAPSGGAPAGCDPTSGAPAGSTPGVGGPVEPRSGTIPGFSLLGDLLADVLPGSPVGVHRDNRRVADVWRTVMGAEAAANSQPRHLRKGRLVVATQSSAWAQALQDQENEIIERLNSHLGQGLILSISFRPAGWDPCAGPDAPRPLAAGPGGWAQTDEEGEDLSGEVSQGGRRKPARALTEEEQRAVEEARASAVDRHLGDLIAAAMKASLEHSDGGEGEG